MSGAASDRLRLDVFGHLFASVAEEMGACLQRSSFSPNIRERRDFSCALFDADGRMIGQAAHLPVHLGSCPRSVQAVIATTPMRAGDAVLLNDPFQGGTHLPDMTLVSPVFVGSEERPSFYVANRAHHADVGGAFPGSMAPALDVHGEGVRVPPLHLVREGKLCADILTLLLANMRIPREREGDLLAQWSTNRLGVERLLGLADEFGAPEVRLRGDQLITWTADLVEELVAGWPKRLDLRFEDALQDDAGDLTIRLRLHRRKGRLCFDFTETDARPTQHLNAPRAVTESAVFYCLRLLLPPGSPTNDGCLLPVDVLTTPGSLVDARYPASVAAGNVETSQRIVDVVLGALAQVEPGRVPAASAGTMSNLTFAGERTGEHGLERYTYYETIPGGAGAGPVRSGASTVQTHMTNTRNTPIEEFELQHPVRVLALERRSGSGGAGAHRGGDGLRKVLRFLRPADVAWVAQRSTYGPWGLAGGQAGLPGGARLLDPSGQPSVAPGTPVSGATRLEAGAGLVIETPGGGGFGPTSC